MTWLPASSVSCSRWNQMARPGVPAKAIAVGAALIKWILILLIIAAVASLLGFPRLAGTAAAAARLLIGIVLVLFLLVLFGLIVVA